MAGEALTTVPTCKTLGCDEAAWTRATGEGGPRVAVSDKCITCARGVLEVEWKPTTGEACPECLWLIGHEMDLGTGKPRCSRALKTEREQGWNEAIEAAANACLVLTEGQRGGILTILAMAERDIRNLKK